MRYLQIFMMGGVLALPFKVMAGGLFLYEVATDNVGLVNAGSAARVQGPSTVYANPAGIGLLTGTQISVGGQALFGDLTFDREFATNTAGADSDNALGPTPGVSFFITHQLDEQWAIGFGSYGDFGLAVDYDDDWYGRYFAQSSSIAGLSLLPSVAYRINDKWAVGVGIRAMYSQLKSEAAIDQTPFGFTDREDGQYKFRDGAWGYGANIGVIYDPRAGTRLGLAYTSQVDIDFEDGLDIAASSPLVSRLDGLDTKIKLKVPQTATLSLSQQINPQWTFLASINWQDWSRFGDVGIELDTSLAGPRSTSVNAGYKDTYHVSLGAQYQFSPALLWSLGAAYDTSAVSDSNRTVTVPMGSARRIGTGVTYSVDESTDLNLSWVAVWMGDMPVDQQKALSNNRVSGEFSDTWIQAVTGNMTWRF